MTQDVIGPLYPTELVKAPVRERVDFLKSRFVAHRRLTEVAEMMKRAILCPADRALLMVIGPTGVGKSTCRRLVQKLLRTELRAELEKDRSMLPYLAIEAPETGGPFNWSDFDKRLLITAEEPFLDSKISYRSNVLLRRPDDRIEVKAQVVRGDLRQCVEEVLRNRRPAALMIDEAAHIFNVASGNAYRKQLDALKSLANLGGTVIVLFGAYDLLSTLGPQLTRRRRTVHFRRYRWEESRSPDTGARLEFESGGGTGSKCGKIYATHIRSSGGRSELKWVFWAAPFSNLESHQTSQCVRRSGIPGP
jgi:type II secretory pathway predicted ATPase ExeA